jgi:HEAT repeat protein
MQAKDELRQIFKSSDPEIRERALDAMGVAGDVETLLEVARQGQDISLRRKAIQSLGVYGGPQSAETLRSIYAAAPDPTIRGAVIEALFVQQNARALIDLYRTEKDRKVRREIVRYLSIMDSEEATQFMSKIFEG